MGVKEIFDKLSTALWQGLLVVAIVGLVWWVTGNAVSNLDQYGLRPGFGFLTQSANFEISESLLPYSPDNSILHAITVGLLNTVKISIIGCILAILLGFLLGILRLSSNPLMRFFVRTYVELLRNVPLLLLLLVCALFIHGLPSPKVGLQPFLSIIITNRGVFLPYPELVWHQVIVSFALAGSLMFLPLLGRRAWPAIATLVLILAGTFAMSPPVWSVPHLTGFNYSGGLTVSAEFLALLLALVVHHAVHASEAVRGAILAVPESQREAAQALGLSNHQTMRLIILPQAMRAVVPPLTSCCVSLIKNTSLAVAIGYPEIVSILNTIANQTGHGLETMAIMFGIYALLGLTFTALLNYYNSIIQRHGGQNE